MKVFSRTFIRFIDKFWGYRHFVLGQLFIRVSPEDGTCMSWLCRISWGDREITYLFGVFSLSIAKLRKSNYKIYCFIILKRKK